jgi:hypothetical protein
MEVSMDNHTFCRLYYNETMKTVKQVTTAAARKECWPWHFHGDHREWHGPRDLETGKQFYWHGSACCAWMAKAHGWEAWLETCPAYHKLMELKKEMKKGGD